jgi:hypothetical protein
MLVADRQYPPGQPRISSIRDILPHIMVFSPGIGRSRMTIDRAKAERIRQQQVKTLNVVGVPHSMRTKETVGFPGSGGPL